ncbi:VOC family protein [Pseudooceanicola algae]|uniref:Glyoxalase-like domain-containing protein n=1 Tax=Pseudooceanicola algae TaxID=1537215 RepID=A0A418SGA8_9RHOB|nr:VOC family protein [Pseudooceanicola algae]QPM91716.1 hypothetical protein PSAL_029710 [Pseudooceanicola algae]
MAGAAFDHLVLAAATLAEGVAHAETALGIPLPGGGAHPLMGTHNRLLKLGEASFLEVIAPDPQASPPDRPRWFGLDHPPARPRLLHWVIRLPGLAQLRADLPQALGPVIEGRRGDLRWLITVPDDGSLPHDGAFPTVIDWCAKHDADLPPRRMAGAGLELSRLDIRHPRASALAAQLAPYLADPRIHFIDADTVSLQARISGPDGIRTLS